MGEKRIYWLIPFGKGGGDGEPQVYHAWFFESGISLCKRWFMGGACDAEEWHRGLPRCKKCLQRAKAVRNGRSRLVKELNSS